MQRHVKVVLGPAQHDELQGGPGAPEQRGGGQRDLAELVLPEHAHATGEVAQQPRRTAVFGLVIDPSVGHVQIDEGGNAVEQGDAGHAVDEQVAAVHADHGVGHVGEMSGNRRADQPAA